VSVFSPLSLALFCSLFLSFAFAAPVASYVDAAEENSPFHLGSVSFVFYRLLCFLPLPGIKLRGGSDSVS
jgi:hypothetical protein